MRAALTSLVPLVSTAALLAACFSETKTDAPSDGPVTFRRDVAPLLRERCQGCHVEGGIAPFPLVTYAQVKPMAASIVRATSSGIMPPWGAETTPECAPRHKFRDDPRLDDKQLALLKTWADTGAPEGAGDLPGARPLSVGLEGAESLKPPVPFAPPPGKDTLRCFVLDPQLTGQRFMTAAYFVPQNPSIVHHALAFAIPATSKAPGEEYDCFGGPRAPGASLIAPWAPGTAPMELPKGVALPLEAGTRFVVQIHYHPHANASPTPDATMFQYRLSNEIPEYVAIPRLIGNFEKPVGDPELASIQGLEGAGLLPGPNDDGSVKFLIPADAKGHTETMFFRMPPKLRDREVGELGVLGIGAHMHLVGVDQKITVKRATPTATDPADECLLHVPRWDFDWQRGFQYDAPVADLPKIRAGDELSIRCTYDNTMRNTQMSRGLAELSLTSPQAVKLGESTLDEMCLGAFVFVRKLFP